MSDTPQQQINDARELFTRLSKGDTAGYGLPESMAHDIRDNLKKAGVDAAALDPEGKKSAADMDKALSMAVAVQKAKDPNYVAPARDNGVIVPSVPKEPAPVKQR